MSKNMEPLKGRRSMPYNPIVYRLEQSLRGAWNKLEEVGELIDEAKEAVEKKTPGAAKDVLLRMNRALNGAISAVVYSQALEFVNQHPHITVRRSHEEAQEEGSQAHLR